MSNIANLENQRFGKLVAKHRTNKKSKSGCYFWECLCDCGNTTLVNVNNLKNGHTKSCGCTKKMKEKNPRLYSIWRHMKSRCYTNSSANKYYCLKGIKVCKEWKNDFISFYEWAMKNGYQNNLTIDRINNEGNYEPNNCRWVTYKEQANNRTNNYLLTYNGETHTIAEWADIMHINYWTLRSRIKRKCSQDRIFKELKKN